MHIIVWVILFSQAQQDNYQSGRTDSPKMKFVKGFIQAYDDTEEEYQYEKRANDDNVTKLSKDENNLKKLLEVEEKEIVKYQSELKILENVEQDVIKKSKEVTDQNNKVNVIRINGSNYISLTDLARYANPEEPKIPVQTWMRNKNVVSFLGLWEQMHNPDFKGNEFETFENEAGKNSFYLSPQKWISNTNAIGIISKSGNKYIRRILFVTVQNIIPIASRNFPDNDILLYYRKKRNEGKHHYVAVVDSTTKLLRKIFALVKQYQNNI